jgi:hypothetical protein
MKEARRLGYNIPDEYINNSLPSYGEDEAYYAARKLAILTRRLVLFGKP